MSSSITALLRVYTPLTFDVVEESGEEKSWLPILRLTCIMPLPTSVADTLTGRAFFPLRRGVPAGSWIEAVGASISTFIPETSEVLSFPALSTALSRTFMPLTEAETGIVLVNV